MLDEDYRGDSEHLLEMVTKEDLNLANVAHLKKIVGTQDLSTAFVGFTGKQAWIF